MLRASSSYEYYPFGVVMQSYSSESYRYGFNGQERETELGNGFTSAEFWMYDGRLGRRWNVDPIVKIFESPYACFGNMPIWANDPNGADKEKTTFDGKTYNVWKVENGESLYKIADKIGMKPQQLFDLNKEQQGWTKMGDAGKLSIDQYLYLEKDAIASSGASNSSQSPTSLIPQLPLQEMDYQAKSGGGGGNSTSNKSWSFDFEGNAMEYQNGGRTDSDFGLSNLPEGWPTNGEGLGGIAKHHQWSDGGIAGGGALSSGLAKNAKFGDFFQSAAETSKQGLGLGQSIADYSLKEDGLSIVKADAVKKAVYSRTWYSQEANGSITKRYRESNKATDTLEWHNAGDTLRR